MRWPKKAYVAPGHIRTADGIVGMMSTCQHCTTQQILFCTGIPPLDIYRVRHYLQSGCLGDVLSGIPLSFNGQSTPPGKV